MYALQSDEMSIQFTSWIADELRERARISEQARAERWKFPVILATIGFSFFRVLTP
ncbi:hypothetical protein [Stratiformator vulcanicus]|uniref:Uncharacterized protein n=1 Tax=Stratiformator vulcanicus TaxID=2527980 RepID=A0A517QZ71_9PLAN|nr:hypothetical protein [Stratiformator vulcanicus]QDT36932.1 hypothetical protein Pan189_12960 [Stratiformator vulcanicus]